MTTKFCKDCVHSVRHSVENVARMERFWNALFDTGIYCRAEPRVDPVTGARSLLRCSMARKHGFCGVNGVLFEAKVAK